MRSTSRTAGRPRGWRDTSTRSSWPRRPWWRWWRSYRCSSRSTCRSPSCRCGSRPTCARSAPALPSGTVLLTVPFAVSGSAQPMLWQAVDDMHFRLAGAALKTPNAVGGPVGQGAPGSARRILSDLTVVGGTRPTGTPAQIATVRQCPAGVAGAGGGDRRRQPRPGVRLGVLHHGPRHRPGLRGRRLGVDAATREDRRAHPPPAPPWHCAGRQPPRRTTARTRSRCRSVCSSRREGPERAPS